MNSSIKFCLLAVAAGLLFMTGCKKDSTPAPTAMLKFHIHTNLGSSEADSGDVHANPAGKNILLSHAQFYLSGIKLIKTDGSTVSVSGTVLVKMGNEEYTVGNIPVGTYKSATFNVGVQPSENHTDPSAHTGTSLATQSPAMHYPATADGYIFMLVDGLIDSSGSGIPDKAFSYQIGTDALLKTVTLGDHTAAPYSRAYDATANGLIEIHMIADYNKLFGNVDMVQNNQSNSIDAWSANIAATLAGNIPTMFDYEE